MRNYQPKVNQTQQYSDSQGEHVVCEGKLLLLDKLNLETYAMKGDLAKGDKTGKLYIHNGGVLSSKKIYPIIISETEEIEMGDYVFNTKYPEREVDKVKSISPVSGMGNFSGEDRGRFHYATKKYGNYYGSDKNTFKVLALPEHFSDKHLQAIADSKIKDGNEVLVKCKKWKSQYLHGYEVDLDQQNHITLFPAEQSLEKAALQHAEKHTSGILDSPINAFKAGAEWAVKNNYKGE